MNITPYHSNFNKTYPFSGSIQIYLAFNIELTYTIPGTNADRYQAQFSWPLDSTVWVSLNHSVALPISGTITEVDNCERNPNKLYVQGGDVLHFISEYITLSAGMKLLSIPN